MLFGVGQTKDAFFEKSHCEWIVAWGFNKKQNINITEIDRPKLLLLWVIFYDLGNIKVK